MHVTHESNIYANPTGTATAVSDRLNQLWLQSVLVLAYFISICHMHNCK